MCKFKINKKEFATNCSTCWQKVSLDSKMVAALLWTVAEIPTIKTLILYIVKYPSAEYSKNEILN